MNGDTNLSKLSFLGAEILHYDCRNQDADGLLRMDIACDLTRPLAEKLGIASIFNVDCVKRIPLTIADIVITGLKLSCSGNESADLDMLAFRLSDFRVIRHEEEGSVERLLRFHIFASEECTPLVSAFRASNRKQKGQLVVELAQGELFEEQEQQEPKQEAAASAPEQKKRGRRTAPFGKTAPEETAAQV